MDFSLKQYKMVYKRKELKYYVKQRSVCKQKKKIKGKF